MKKANAEKKRRELAATAIQQLKIQLKEDDDTRRQTRSDTARNKKRVGDVISKVSTHVRGVIDTVMAGSKSVTVTPEDVARIYNAIKESGSSLVGEAHDHFMTTFKPYMTKGELGMEDSWRRVARYNPEHLKAWQEAAYHHYQELSVKLGQKNSKFLANLNNAIAQLITVLSSIGRAMLSHLPKHPIAVASRILTDLYDVIFYGIQEGDSIGEAQYTRIRAVADMLYSGGASELGGSYDVDFAKNPMIESQGKGLGRSLFDSVFASQSQKEQYLSKKEMMWHSYVGRVAEIRREMLEQRELISSSGGMSPGKLMKLSDMRIISKIVAFIESYSDRMAPYMFSHLGYYMQFREDTVNYTSKSGLKTFEKKTPTGGSSVFCGSLHRYTSKVTDVYASGSSVPIKYQGENPAEANILVVASGPCVYYRMSAVATEPKPRTMEPRVMVQSNRFSVIREMRWFPVALPLILETLSSEGAWNELVEKYSKTAVFSAAVQSFLRDLMGERTDFIDKAVWSRFIPKGVLHRMIRTWRTSMKDLANSVKKAVEFQALVDTTMLYQAIHGSRSEDFLYSKESQKKMSHGTITYQDVLFENKYKALESIPEAAADSDTYSKMFDLCEAYKSTKDFEIIDATPFGTAIPGKFFPIPDVLEIYGAEHLSKDARTFYNNRMEDIAHVIYGPEKTEERTQHVMPDFMTVVKITEALKELSRETQNDSDIESMQTNWPSTIM